MRVPEWLVTLFMRCLRFGGPCSLTIHFKDGTVTKYEVTEFGKP